MYNRCLQYLVRVFTTGPTRVLRIQSGTCNTQWRFMSSETSNTEKLREEELNYDKLHTSVFADKVVDLLNPRDNQVVLNVNQGIWIAFFILSCGGLLSSNTVVLPGKVCVALQPSENSCIKKRRNHSSRMRTAFLLPGGLPPLPH